jgi:hypothetical protein
VTKPISFEEFVAKKRQRPEQICFACGKQKEIFTHLGGEQDKPLCNACNMKLRRDSPGAAQVKLLKLCATAIGSVEAMLALPVEERQKRSLQDMQDELKLMIRVWLGDTQADKEANATTSTQEATDAPTGPASDEFAEARKAAVSEPADNSFEAPKNQPSAGKSRRPTEDTTETTPHGYFARLNRKPKNATQTAQPWEIFLDINGEKPKLCCRASNKQDAEAQMWKLDRMAKEEKQSTPTATNNEAAGAA